LMKARAARRGRPSNGSSEPRPWGRTVGSHDRPLAAQPGHLHGSKRRTAVPPRADLRGGYQALDFILGDWSRYLLISSDIKPMMSAHVVFLSSEVLIRLVLRVDGMPEYSSAVTPYVGSNQQSPFVCVAVRS